MGWKGLRWRQHFTVNGPLRNGMLLDRPNRLSAVAIQYKNKPLLGWLDQDIAQPIAGVEARERRLRGYIVIPDIVMHGLEGPHDFATICVERADRIGVLVVAGPLAPGA